MRIEIESKRNKRKNCRRKSRNNRKTRRNNSVRNEMALEKRRNDRKPLIRGFFDVM
jgi:hypothetical protein